MVDHPASNVRLFLVRHGEVDPYWHGRRVYGDLDVPLSPRGVEQSRRLVSRFEDAELRAAYSSHLERAALPARGIGESYGIPHHVVEDFREVYRGNWRELAWEDIRARWPGEPERFAREPDHPNSSEGETLREVSDRSLAALSHALAKHPGESIALFCHSWVVRSILCDALAMPLGECERLAVDPAAIAIIDYPGENGARPRVRAMNLAGGEDGTPLPR